MTPTDTQKPVKQGKPKAAHPQKPKPAPRRPASVFAGRGIWVWNAGDHNADALAAKASRHGFGYLAVKGHDGTTQYNSTAELRAYELACRRHGLKLVIWGYLSGQDPAGEARLAAELVNRFGAHAYLADAEIEYEQAARPVSREFAAAFRHHHPSLEAGVSTFGRIDLHRGLDTRAFRDRGFSLHVQAYECETSALEPRYCVAAARALGWPLRSIHVTLGAYRGAASRPSGAQLHASLDGTGTHGFNVWEAASMLDDDYRALGQPVHRPRVRRLLPLGELPYTAFAHGLGARFARATNEGPAPKLEGSERRTSSSGAATLVVKRADSSPQGHLSAAPLSPAKSPALRFRLTRSQILHALTPAFTALGGFVSSEVATLTPVHLSSGEVTATFVAGAAAALAAAIHYLHGHGVGQPGDVVDVEDK